MKVGVIGAGSWGTALARMLAENDNEVALWFRTPELAAAAERARENKVYLPGFPFPQRLRTTTSMEEAVAGADALVAACPSHAMRAVFSAAAPHLEGSPLIVSASKGIEGGTLRRMTEVLVDVVMQQIGVRNDRAAAVVRRTTVREVVVVLHQLPGFEIRVPGAAVVAAADLQGDRARVAAGHGEDRDVHVDPGRRQHHVAVVAVVAGGGTVEGGLFVGGEIARERVLEVLHRRAGHGKKRVEAVLLRYKPCENIERDPLRFRFRQPSTPLPSLLLRDTSFHRVEDFACRCLRFG